MEAPSSQPLNLYYTSQNQLGGLRNIAWSPHTNWLAFGAADGTVQLCDVVGKDQMHTLQGHIGDVYSVAWSSDDRLASGSADCTVRLWDASHQCAGHILRGHTGIVNSVAWSPDGKRVASGSADKMLRLWDASHGRELHTLTGHTNYVMSVAWSPDGRRLASGSRDQTVRLWDAHSGRELRALQGHEIDVISVAWSPDGSRLASGSHDRTVRLWDASNKRELHILQGHTSVVTVVAWSPNGHLLASSSYDRTVRLWDTHLGRELYILRGHASGIIGLAWSPDGSRLATASHHEIYLWRTNDWELIAVLNDLQGFRAVVRPQAIAQCLDRKRDDEPQRDALVEGRQPIICSSCSSVLPERQVINRRKRGLDYMICSHCGTRVSLLDNQEQQCESNGEVMSGSVQLASERGEQQSVQKMLQRKIDAQAFDVFLCYNEQDKPAVKLIAEQLKQHGILPWFDEWELRPGLPWQRLLAQRIVQIKAAAVFIGQSNNLSWQHMEIDALLREFAQRGCPIIPVLLSNAPITPEVPLFLRGMTWVDFRVQEPDPMRLLLWGITGEK